MILKTEFTEFIPDELAKDTLYVSIPHRTVIHLCACGCGLEVVTPLDPTDWNVTFDGETVSLHPSIGNWSFPCRSHYWIKKSKIFWAPSWSDEEVQAGRDYDKRRKARRYADAANAAEDDRDEPVVEDERETFIEKLKKWINKLWR